MLVIAASAASAETLMMPNRDMQMGVSEVVWGITTLPNAGTTFSIDFGDGSVTAFAAVLAAGRDRSYINLNHTYALANTYTATLTVRPTAGPDETATVTIRVFDRNALNDVEKRGLDVNRAIENGLRYLWTADANRTAFDTNPVASWDNPSYTALVALAYENHGYKLPNNDNTPTGLYEKYAVQRGLNNVFSTYFAQTLTVQAHLDPCQGGVGCGGLQANFNNVGYSTAIASLPISGSSALSRHVTVGLASIIGQTYGQVLQRNINTVVFNQCDSAGPSRGGWAYGQNGCGSDSSVVGWDLLALFDGEAAGAVLPPGAGVGLPSAVKTEFGTVGGDGNTHALDGHRNDTDGSFDYTANTSELANDGIGKNLAKTAIGLQGLFFVGETTGARVNLTVGEINNWFPSGAVPSGANYACGNGTYNLGCGYGMFNAFKALKLLGIGTLPNVGRPAGPGAIPANDWYAYYVDWLIANQTTPTTAAGGYWAGLYFSSSDNSTQGDAALAELILSPVALISPDPTLFGSVGLSQGNPPNQNPDTNPVDTDHTVTALVESATHTPIPGATVGFTVSGHNVGASGVCAPVGCVTGADGKVAFTYHGNATAGQDTIQANIGTLLSNILVKNWILPTIKCDATGDGLVTQADLLIIRAANGQVASGPTDPRDGNSDGVINVLDVRYCQFRLTPQ
jgi:PKD repeat protein